MTSTPVCSEVKAVLKRWAATYAHACLVSPAEKTAVTLLLDDLEAALEADARPVVALAPSRQGRVYIAGPMTGLPEFNFPAFNAAAARLAADGFTPVNPADHGLVDGAQWGDYLRYDLAQLVGCEAIYFLTGWSHSRGARLEHSLAQALGMELRFEPGAEHHVYQATPEIPPAVALGTWQGQAVAGGQPGNGPIAFVEGLTYSSLLDGTPIYASAVPDLPNDEGPWGGTDLGLREQLRCLTRHVGAGPESLQNLLDLEVVTDPDLLQLAATLGPQVAFGPENADLTRKHPSANGTSELQALDVTPLGQERLHRRVVRAGKRAMLLHGFLTEAIQAQTSDERIAKLLRQRKASMDRLEDRLTPLVTVPGQALSLALEALTQGAPSDHEAALRAIVQLLGSSSTS